MKSHTKSTPHPSASDRCDKCEELMNPTIYTYNGHLHLCTDCFEIINDLDDITAENMERFLIGNVI